MVLGGRLVRVFRCGWMESLAKGGWKVEKRGGGKKREKRTVDAPRARLC